VGVRLPMNSRARKCTGEKGVLRGKIPQGGSWWKEIKWLIERKGELLKDKSCHQRRRGLKKERELGTDPLLIEKCPFATQKSRGKAGKKSRSTGSRCLAFKMEEKRRTIKRRNPAGGKGVEQSKVVL